MTNTKSPTTPPATAGGALQAREEAAREYTGKQEHSKSWKPLTNSSPVSFMALRTGMCRWPIGDPHQFETLPLLRLQMLGGSHLLHDAQEARLGPEPRPGSRRPAGACNCPPQKSRNPRALAKATSIAALEMIVDHPRRRLVDAGRLLEV